MFRPTQEIYDVLRTHEGLKVFTEENERSSEVWLQFGVKSGGSYRIRFISNDDDHDVAVRVYRLLSVNDDQLPRIYPVLNKINDTFRFVKFVCDEDNDINVAFDFPRDSSPADSAFEIVIRFAQIIDEAYPMLMKALWS